MYKDYWKLRQQPFDNTPDPAFFYSSERHQEALSRFQYLVRSKTPCGLLTGVYGCGKTLVIQALRSGTEPEGIRYSIVTNPRLDDMGILRLILRGLTHQEVPSNKADVLMQLQEYVEKVAQDGKHTVIVIDEAHAIEAPGVFEELRLLLDFQTATQSLLTLLLAGQPELRPRVETNMQLNQRISLRFHLDAFTEEETGEYIRHRLKIAGAAKNPFTPQSMALVYAHSKGIPRWINHYCHMSLLEGFGRKVAAITPEIVEQAVQSLTGK